MLKYWLKQNYQLAKAHIDWARGAPKLHRRFFRKHGYQLNLENPQTFSEKIQWRKLYDKNPIFPVLSNKYLVRQYIADKLGHDRAQELLVPLLQYSEDPGKIDFETLPSQFVLKATHGSSMNLIVEDAAQLDQSATRATMRKWLLTNYGLRDHEWVYAKTSKGILVEELIAPSSQLIDVKIFCFDGIMRGFLVEQNGESFIQTHFNCDGQPLDAGRVNVARNLDAKPPSQLNEMIHVGEILCGNLDFVRVDFMCTADRFYMGELSLLHGSGLKALSPKSYDLQLGSFWRLF